MEVASPPCPSLLPLPPSIPPSPSLRHISLHHLSLIPLLLLPAPHPSVTPLYPSLSHLSLHHPSLIPPSPLYLALQHHSLSLPPPLFVTYPSITPLLSLPQPNLTCFSSPGRKWHHLLASDSDPGLWGLLGVRLHSVWRSECNLRVTPLWELLEPILLY